MTWLMKLKSVKKTNYNAAEIYIAAVRLKKLRYAYVFFLHIL